MGLSMVEAHAAAIEHKRYVECLDALASPAQQAIARKYGKGFVSLSDYRKELQRLLGIRTPKHPIYNP